MIHKFQNLTSIGKFRSYQATGDVALKKFTLVYADNGSGKTTLAAVLRSLTENKPEIIRRRISTGTVPEQAAQIIQRSPTGDTSHSFGVSGWSQNFNDIEIFDTHFVNDNIYSGFEFSEEHKKQLHQFVIGAQGVAIQQEIEQNKADKTASRLRIESYGRDILASVGNGLPLDRLNAFLGIPVTELVDIDAKIAVAQSALVNARANSVIITIPALEPMPKLISGIAFEDIARDLRETIETIQDAALKTVYTAHCEDLSSNSVGSPDAWLKTGYGYLKSKQHADGEIGCPFCKKTIDTQTDIIKAYIQRFNEAYNSFIAKIQGHLNVLQAVNLDNSIQRMDNVNQRNSEYAALWASHYTGPAQPPFYPIIPDVALLQTQFAEVIAVVTQKSLNPSVECDVNPLTALLATLVTIDRNIDRYNGERIVYHGATTAFRASIQTEVIALAVLNRLQCIKRRHEADVKTLCINLETEQQNLKNLEAAYPILTGRQEAAARTFFTAYQTRINYYLATTFRTPFRIENVTHVAPQGRATQSKVAYKLTMNGQDISFDPNQNINAKDCLSEGDRSTLALAFFLAKLDIDARKADKVLVFDDPLSSLDSNRRLNTVELIKSLLPQLKQVIVLSHNEYFLHLLYNGIAPSEKKTLRIAENLTTGAAIIEEFDLEKLVENDYFKHVKELQDFLVHADIAKKDTVLGLMRNVLEAHIRFKFYRQTSSLSPNQRTFGNLISILDTTPVAFRVNADRVSILAKLRLINNISSRPHHGEPIPDYNTLGINPNSMTVTELGGFVRDTLDLIDNLL